MSESTTVVRGIDASYYMTKNLDAATKYYNDLLGCEPSVHLAGMFSEYTFSDESSFGLYQSENFYKSGTILFRVDDVAAFVAAAKAKGVVFAGDGHVDDTPNCHMAFGTDLDGNQFIVHKVK